MTGIDLVFNGGKYAMWTGNQQFTVRNVTINDAQTGAYSSGCYGDGQLNIPQPSTWIGIGAGHSKA